MTDAGRRTASVAVACVVAATVMFAVNGGVSRILLRADVAPTSLISFRLTVALVLLVAWAAATSPQSLRPPRGGLIVVVVVHGVVGVAALQCLFLVAVDRLALGLALTVQYMAPLMVAVWVRSVQRILLPRRVWVGLGLSLLGLAVVTQIWTGVSADPVGLLAAVGASGCFAAYFIVGEIGAAKTQALHLLIWSFAAGVLALNLVAPFWSLLSLLGSDVDVGGRLGGSVVPLWAALTWFVLMGTVVPYVMVLLAMRRLSATVVSGTHMLEPAVGYTVGWLWFAESMTPIEIVGCAAVIAGVLMTLRRTRAATEEIWSAG